MDNFQLYRTNIELSGQVKWDLVLESAGENLIVKNFLLSPVSEELIYNKYTDDNILKYPHQDNVKKLYKNIGESFYSHIANSLLTSEYPIITDEQCINSHIGDFEMGCRRNKTYKIHNKQYYFLCPVWLEMLKTDETIVFEISAYSNNKKISSKTVSFNNVYATSSEEEYHNKFVKYFQNYLNFTKISSWFGNNDIINVDLNNQSLSISGLNVSTGEFLDKKEMPEIYNDLICREKALIENDAELLALFKQNNLIAPQLFNFALYFNPEDILPIMFLKDLKGKFITYKVTVSIGALSTSNYKDLDIVDFYSNYEYIPRYYCGAIDSSYEEDLKIVNTLHDSKIPNVLSYLSDFNHVNLTTSNKMIQNTFHWSLVKNNNYIFNLYPGFKGFALDENLNQSNPILYMNNSLYMDTPDIYSEYYSQSLNNIGWCNWVNLYDGSSLFSNFEKYRLLASNFKEEWVHNIYYNPLFRKARMKYLYSKDENILDLIDDDLNILLVRNKSGKDISISYDQLQENGLDGRIALYSYEYMDETIQFVLYNHTANWNDNESYDDSLTEISKNLSNYTLIIASQCDDLLTFRGFYNILNKEKIFTYNYNEDVNGYGSGSDIYELFGNKQDRLYKGDLISSLKYDISHEIDNILNNGKYIEYISQQFPNNKLYKKNLLHILLAISSSMYSPEVDKITRVDLQKSIKVVKAIGPSADTIEIIFNKSTSPGPTVYRYGGKIKPTFIKESDNRKNFLYYKDYLSAEDSEDELGIPINSPWKNSVYSKYNNIYGYAFPSIGYCAIKKIDNWDYQKIPNTHLNKPIINDIEYHWYNNGMHIALISELNFKLESKIIDNKYVNLVDLIKEYIGEYYGISGSILEYVFSLYEYENFFEYKNIKDIKNYIYDIKLTLL